MRVVAFGPLLCLTALVSGLSACSEAADGQPTTYAALADKVATIPLSPREPSAIAHPTQVNLPLETNPEHDGPRPSLKVELMSPHQLWDLRDGPLKVPEIEVPEGTTLALPVSISAPVVNVAPQLPATTAAASTDGTAFRTVQLGAFSSEASAREAWNRLSTGPSAAALSGLMPQFEPAEVGGRQLVRLRVSAREDRVQALCQSVAAADPWCVRAGGSATPSTIFH